LRSSTRSGTSSVTLWNTIYPIYMWVTVKI
jgi:hypothetical protein